MQFAENLKAKMDRSKTLLPEMKNQTIAEESSSSLSSARSSSSSDLTSIIESDTSNVPNTIQNSNFKKNCRRLQDIERKVSSRGPQIVVDY